MSREKPWIEDKMTCFLSKINLTTASIHLIAVMRLKIFVVFVTFHIFWAHEIHAQGVNEETGTDKPASYELEAVTVTSQKREEILQDVSGSITSFSQIELEDAGIDSILDLSRLVPGLEFDDFRHGAMFLRGIKSMPSSEPGTGFYVDGVNYSKSFMFGFPLFDVERVEVLKGPQGTLYGRNTIGGVINVHTVEPTNQAMCRLGGTLGDYGKKEFQGSVSFPLIQNRLFMRIAGAASEQDGYSENDVSPESHDNKDGHHLDGKAGRVKFRFLPTEKWDIALNIDGQWHDDGAFPTSRTERNPQVKTGLVPADAPYHYSNDYDGWQERTFWGAALNTKYDLKNVQLTSITSYRDYDRNEGIDTDFSALDLKRRKYRTREKDFSQEFRIVSDIDSALFKWQAGVNYFHLDTENTNANIFRPGMALSPSNPLNGTGTRAFFTDNVNAGGAVFGEVTYTLWHRLDLTGGLRYEYERAETDSAMRDMPDGAAAIERGRISSENSFSTLLPKVTAGWHFTDAHMAYTTFSEAHRSGGFNGFSAPQGDESFDEESSRVYELGTKSTFIDNRLMVNLALFYIKIQNEQLNLFNAKSMQPYIANAGSSHRKGLEVETKYIVLPGLELSGTFSYVDARFDNYKDPVTDMDYAGNRVFSVPKYTYSLSAQYRYPMGKRLTLFSRADLSGAGDRYFDDANTVRSPSYEVVNLKVGLESNKLDCYIWAQNVFDEEYRTYENTSIGITEYGMPRTIGVTASYRF